MADAMALLSPPAPRTGEAPTPATRRRKRAAPGLWLLPSLLTLVVTLHRIGEPRLWRDELTSWDVSGRSAGDVLATAWRVDAVVGPYYLVLGACRDVLGDSPVALRLPSALAMTATAACVVLIGRRLFGRRAGLAAGLLFALVPAVTRYAHEARPYAFAMLAAALAALLLLRALEEPESPRRWAVYGLCVVAVGLFHLIALICLAAHLALVARRARREPRAPRAFALAAGAAVVALSPLIALGATQTARQSSWIDEPDLTGLFGVWPELFHSGVCAGVVLLLAVAARGQRRDGVVLCSVWAVLPPLVVWAVSHGEISYFHPRYVLFTLPAFVVLAGAGLAAVARFRAALVWALVLLAVVTLPDHRALRRPFAHYGPGAPDHAAAARIIERYHVPGDGIVHDRHEEGGMFALGVLYHLPTRLNPRDVFLAEPAAHRADLLSADCPRPARCLGGEPRIWLVVKGRYANPLDGLPPHQAAALRSLYTVAGAERPGGMTVALLVRRA
jgi:mannosyltransferase